MCLGIDEWYVRIQPSLPEVVRFVHPNSWDIPLITMLLVLALSDGLIQRRCDCLLA